MQKQAKNKEILTDQFGRVHDYLRMSLTERCNLRCFYCMPENGIQLRPREEFMRQEEVLQLANTFVELGVKKIRLTGGEPLIRKDADSIITELGKLPVELAITTNGVIVDKFVEIFKDAGIKGVNVSLDSLQPEKQERIARRDYFERILANIELLLKEGFKVKVNAVVMRDVNDDEIIDFVKLSEHKPLDIRFIEFMPFLGNDWNWEKKVNHDEVMERVYDYYSKESVKRVAAKANDTAQNYQIDGYTGTFGMISSVTHPFCSTCNRIRLTADGKIKNCLFSNSELDLLTSLRKGENVESLIRQSIASKKEVRAGIDSFKNAENLTSIRSMVSIGG